jgi:hypothetical protein
LPFHKRDTFHILKTGNILSLNGTKNTVLIPSHHRYFTVPGRFGQKKSRNLVNFFYSEGKSIFVSMPQNLLGYSSSGGLNVKITNKFVVYAPAERAETLLLFPFYPSLLCGKYL